MSAQSNYVDVAPVNGVKTGAHVKQTALPGKLGGTVTPAAQPATPSPTWDPLATFRAPCPLILEEQQLSIPPPPDEGVGTLGRNSYSLRHDAPGMNHMVRSP